MEVSYEIHFQATLFPDIQTSLPSTRRSQSGPRTGLDALEKREEPTAQTSTNQITKLSIPQRKLFVLTYIIFTTVIMYYLFIYFRDKWFPVTTAWRVLRMRMEERPPILWTAANILNKLSRAADKGWYPTLGVGRDTNNSSPSKRILLQNSHGKP
jgi:hypothetical protein